MIRKHSIDFNSYICEQLKTKPNNSMHLTSQESRIVEAAVKMDCIICNLNSLPSGMRGAYISNLVLNHMGGASDDIKLLLKINRTLRKYCKLGYKHSGIVWLTTLDIASYIEYLTDSSIYTLELDKKHQLKYMFDEAQYKYNFTINMSKLQFVRSDYNWILTYKHNNKWFNMDNQEIHPIETMSINTYQEAKNSMFGDLLLF